MQLSLKSLFLLFKGFFFFPVCFFVFIRIHGLLKCFDGAVVREIIIVFSELIEGIIPDGFENELRRGLDYVRDIVIRPLYGLLDLLIRGFKKTA